MKNLFIATEFSKVSSVLVAVEPTTEPLTISCEVADLFPSCDTVVKAVTVFPAGDMANGSLLKCFIGTYVFNFIADYLRAHDFPSISARIQISRSILRSTTE